MSQNYFHKVSHQKDEEEKQNVEKDASCDVIFKKLTLKKNQRL